MKLLKKLFQKNYCSNCEYRSHYFESSRLKRKTNLFENKQKNFLNNIRNILNFSNEIIVYLNPVNESPLVMITLITSHDFYGKIDTLDFYGYPNCYMNNPLKKTKLERLSISAIYDSKKGYLDHFYIDCFPCTPNLGYGSLLIQTAINLLITFDAPSLTGKITPDITEENHSRAVHFYTKYGFEIHKRNNAEYLYLDLKKAKSSLNLTTNF